MSFFQMKFLSDFWSKSKIGKSQFRSDVFEPAESCKQFLAKYLATGKFQVSFINFTEFHFAFEKKIPFITSNKIIL